MIHVPARLLNIRRMDTDFRSEAGSTHMLVIVALGFGATVFFVTECMHYLLVPNLGRHAERMVAEGVSALIVGCLAAMLFRSAREHRQATRARLQVIAEMNHHIRNALTPISLSAYAAQDQQSIRVIAEGVERIEWALREILPRQRPLPDRERNRLCYFAWKEEHDSMPSAAETRKSRVSEQTNHEPPTTTTQPTTNLRDALGAGRASRDQQVSTASAQGEQS
jgi:hypothetical protein